MEFRDVFKRLGLGKNAPAVYAALLENKKPMLVAHIAQAIHIDRPEVYRNLYSCIERGFIEKMKNGRRTYYVARSPKYIERAFDHISDEVRDYLSTKESIKYPKHLVYFKGTDGIRAVFDDVIDRMPAKGTFYRYTSERNLEEVNKYLSPSYRARRDKKKLERLVISNPVSGKLKRSRLERFIKFFPSEVDLFNQNIIQLVYADSLAFINLETKESYILRDKNLAQFQSVIFRQLYKKL